MRIHNEQTNKRQQKKKKNEFMALGYDGTNIVMNRDEVFFNFSFVKCF